MGYTNETTHYGIPLPLGSDKTTPMDYNNAMQAVDTAVFESKTDSSSALQKANQLQEDLADTKDDVTALDGRLTSVEGIQTTQGQNILQNAQDIDDVRADALDMICAVDEGTAQVATVAVQEGEYFRYNDVLYMATDDIAIGDTIVPNTNCRATNVATELLQSETDLSAYQTKNDNSLDTSSKTIVGAINELNAELSDSNYVEVKSDGTITHRVLLNSLYALIDRSKLTTRSKLLYMRTGSTAVYPIQLITDTALEFGHLQFDSPDLTATMVTLNESLSTLIYGGIKDINSPTLYAENNTGNVPTIGLTVRCVY